MIARPVFVGGALVAFACNRAHQADIGGGAAGTYNSAATEIFHEGIRLPVLKLIERGTVRADLWQLLLLNTRLPEALDGDLRAMMGSTRIGAERLALLVEELGADRADDFFEAVLDHADRRFRGCIDRLAARHLARRGVGRQRLLRADRRQDRRRADGRETAS